MLDKQNDIERTAQFSGIEAPSEMLANQVGKVFSSAKTLDRAFDSIVQVRIPVNGLDPLQWLRDQDHEVKMFWESRDMPFFSAGIAVADQVVGAGGASLSRVKHVLKGRLDRAEEAVRYFGGVRFDRAYPERNGWSAFGDFRFTLPRFELRGNGSRQWLCCNLVMPQDLSQQDGITREILALKFSGRPMKGKLPLPVQRNDLPGERRWHNMIESALSRIENGHTVEKVVLARRVEFQFLEPFDRFLLLKLLRDATPQCFHFYFQQDNNASFLGAPPERLYHRRGRDIVSEAVAGTGQRDDRNVVDTQLGHALLLSEKNQREHAFVRQSIEQVFGKICSTMSMDAVPSIMNLSIGKHLRSRVAGVLHQSVSDIDIIRGLAPTSAVGGYPSQEALGMIRELESFDRGWYAGPVGWISKEAAEFAVAIRSGLALSKKLVLYSGAGIVNGSRPDAEWNEIEQKLGDFIRALGLDQRSAKY